MLPCLGLSLLDIHKMARWLQSLSHDGQLTERVHATQALWDFRINHEAVYQELKFKFCQAQFASSGMVRYHNDYSVDYCGQKLEKDFPTCNIYIEIFIVTVSSRLMATAS